MQAAASPSAVTDADVEALHHHSETAVVEIASAVPPFGFLNRWNAPFATSLNTSPGTRAARQGICPLCDVSRPHPASDSLC